MIFRTAVGRRGGIAEATYVQILRFAQDDSESLEMTAFLASIQQHGKRATSVCTARWRGVFGRNGSPRRGRW